MEQRVVIMDVLPSGSARDRLLGVCAAQRGDDQRPLADQMGNLGEGVGHAPEEAGVEVGDQGPLHR